MARDEPVVGRRINGERLALLGWSRAILLQMAHPLIAAGVVDHSNFRSSPVAAARRLHGTVRAMLGLTFGTDEERRRATEHILAIHRRVNGRLRHSVGAFPAGTPYSAEDPALVLWVHATVVQSTILAYRAVVADLNDADLDRYCREASPVAVDLGADPTAVPMDVAALERYVDSMVASNTIEVGPDAHIVATHVLRGPLARVALPAGWLNRLATAAWLPPRLRTSYGLAWSESHRRRFERACRTLRTTRRMTPHWIALWPEARALERVRSGL